MYLTLIDTTHDEALCKRRDKTKVFPNSSGLHVSLSLTGEVTFFNRYCWEGKPIQLTIGDYPSRSPSQARKRLQQFRRWVTENYHPGRQVFRNRLQNMAVKTVEETIGFREEHDCRADGMFKIHTNRQIFKDTV